MAHQQTPVAEFQIHHTVFLDAEGIATQPFPDFATPDTLTELYRLVVLTRQFDTKAVNLQRTGKMGTYPSCRGAEAFGVGIGHALYEDDVFCPYYRDHGTLLQRFRSLTPILQYWGGDERGSDTQHHIEDFPVCVPIASQCLHAAGVAYAIKYREQQRAVVCTLGDGGTSEGDFYEAINVAGAWNLPVVFIVNNNQWAISVPLTQQTHCQTLAQKAIAAGFDGRQVDGNDVIAMRQVVRESLDKARSGNGPTLIEALTYRLCDHTTADDATRYQSPEAVQQAQRNEPILRLQTYLTTQGILSDSDVQQIQQQCKAEVEQAVADYLSCAPDHPTAAFDNLYEQLPDALIEQREEIGVNS